MICCPSNEVKLLGMARVPKSDVIAACKNTLQSIQRCHSKLRRDYVSQWLVLATRRWHFFWRRLGFKQPTRRDALYEYYHGERFFSQHIKDICSYAGQEDKCKKLLKVAIASNHDSMWISPEGANFCNL